MKTSLLPDPKLLVNPEIINPLSGVCSEEPKASDKTPPIEFDQIKFPIESVFII